MNRFWKKQLPALALALVMLAGLAPGALAAECAANAHKWSEWHTSVEPTCKDPGAQTRTCSVCLKTETQRLEKTDLHDTKTLSGGKAGTGTARSASAYRPGSAWQRLAQRQRFERLHRPLGKYDQVN